MSSNWCVLLYLKSNWFHLFFGRIEDTKKTFWNYLTFSLSSKLHNWGQTIAFEYYWTIRSAIFGSTYSNFLSSSSKSSLTLALKRLALPLKELSKCNSTSASQGYQQRHGLCTLEGRRKQEAGNPSPPPPPPTVCYNGFYADISNHHQMQQYKSMFEVISIKFW